MAKKILGVIVVLFCLGKDNSLSDEVWRRIGSIPDNDLWRIVVSHQNIYLGSSKFLFRSKDGGDSWKNISPPGGIKKINSILIPPESPTTIYTATQKGVFVSSNYGEKWKRIFKGVGREGGGIQCLLLDPYRPEEIYIGTEKGLFFSSNNGVVN